MVDEQAQEQDLRDDSDRLLRELGELRSLESEKRQHEVSTPGFHDLADRVVDKSRDIFRTARQEVEDGTFDQPRGRTTEEIPPTGA